MGGGSAGVHPSGAEVSTPPGRTGQVSLTSMRKSPVRSPALQATPSTSTDSRYCSAGKAGVGVNSSMGVSAAERGGRLGRRFATTRPGSTHCAAGRRCGQQAGLPGVGRAGPGVRDTSLGKLPVAPTRMGPRSVRHTTAEVPKSRGGNHCLIWRHSKPRAQRLQRGKEGWRPRTGARAGQGRGWGSREAGVGQ